MGNRWWLPAGEHLRNYLILPPFHRPRRVKPRISNHNYLKSQLSQLLILNSQLSFTARISNWLSVRNKDFLQVSVPKFPLKAPVIWQFQNLVLLLRRQGPDTETEKQPESTNHPHRRRGRGGRVAERRKEVTPSSGSSLPPKG